MKRKNKILKGVLSLFLSFVLTFTALCYTSCALTNTKKSAKYSYSSGNYIYCASTNALYKVNVKTKKKTLLYKNESLRSLSNVRVYEGYVYFCEQLGDTPYFVIYRIKTDGTNLKELAEGHNPIIYKGKIYYNENYDYYGNSSGAYKMNLNGSNKTCISYSTLENFKIYKSYIYYTTNNGIYKINTQGKYRSKIKSCRGATIVKVSNGYIYYSIYNSSSNYLYKYKISSKKTTYLKKYNGEVVGLEGGYLYFTYNAYDTNGIDYLYRLNLSTNKKQILAKGREMNAWLAGENHIVYTYYSSNGDYSYYSYLMNNNGTNKIYLNKFYWCQ